MENKIQHVSLSFCCKKDWNAFQTVDERRRFCGSCEHNVVDFTKATQAELDNALKSGNRVCGRFTREQMSDRFLKYAASTVVAAASVLSTSCEKPAIIKPANAIETSVPEREVEQRHFLGAVATFRDTTLTADSLSKITDHELPRE